MFIPLQNDNCQLQCTLICLPYSPHMLFAPIPTFFKKGYYLTATAKKKKVHFYRILFPMVYNPKPCQLLQRASSSFGVAQLGPNSSIFYLSSMTNNTPSIKYCGKGRKKLRRELVGCHALVAQSCPTLVTPWTADHQAPLSVALHRQEYWSGVPFPSPGDFPNWGTEPTPLVSPALAGRFFITVAPRKLLVKPRDEWACLPHSPSRSPFVEGRGGDLGS